jgi:short-subunit dehydrogenase
MSTVVITGSTKGIGRGLAEEFVKRGHSAVICSRNGDDVMRATAEIAELGTGKCTGVPCDTTDKSQLQRLWDHARQEHGSVDYWINNAGLATARHEVHETPEDLTRTMINSNVIGTTLACQVAISGYREQGHGALYNVLGGSFDGKFLVPNMGVYSSTKAAVHLLTKYLVKENKDRNILVGMISPGTLITDNYFEEQKLLSDEEWLEVRDTLNMICDHVDTVAPWLVEQILANRKNGYRIRWMTNSKMLGRVINTKVLGRKRDVFSRYGI